MTKPKKVRNDKVRENRLKCGMNQKTFWSRFGVTQSRGSRFEAGSKIPTQVAMLIWLHETGRITDEDLGASLQAANTN